MQFPHNLDPEAFLSSYWQKKPLRMPQALAKLEPTLTSGELAWLATQDDVESRLVFTHVDGDSTHYEVRHGPFANDILSSLPRKNWTLLVQDVEKHLPDFRALFAAVDFIPDWRIDDLMVSFAAPGGGVGPHRDNYDVFLCQGEGTREWHLGDRESYTADLSSRDLDLAVPFTDPLARIDSSGDVVYLPPGVPHWGIARDFCMTYSIGMRAPSIAELNAGLARLYDLRDVTSARSSAAGEEVFYTDPDLSRDEARPGLISPAAISRTRALLPRELALDEQQVCMLLGSVVTDPKAWLEPEGVDSEAVTDTISRIAQLGELRVHGMAKLAFFASGNSNMVFANGHGTQATPQEVHFFRNICDSRTMNGNELCANAGPELLRWLLTCAVIDLTELK